MIRLLLADDQSLVRGALAALLALEPDLEVVAEVGSGDEVLDAVREHHPDLLVNYKRVTITYSTHSEGGLTEKDFAGAREATSVATSMGGK